MTGVRIAGCIGLAGLATVASACGQSKHDAAAPPANLAAYRLRHYSAVDLHRTRLLEREVVRESNQHLHGVEGPYSSSSCNRASRTEIAHNFQETGPYAADVRFFLCEFYFRFDKQHQEGPGLFVVSGDGHRWGNPYTFAEPKYGQPSR